MKQAGSRSRTFDLLARDLARYRLCRNSMLVRQGRFPCLQTHGRYNIYIYNLLVKYLGKPGFPWQPWIHPTGCHYLQFTRLTSWRCYLWHTDPYVKVSLLCDGRRLKKRKTTTKKSTLNPVYNEAIIFDIPPENVEQVSLSIMVMDYDRWVKPYNATPTIQHMWWS